jgi:enoyl-CoA hydratase
LGKHLWGRNFAIAANIAKKNDWKPTTLMDEATQLPARLAAQFACALRTTKRAFSKHIARAALSIVDYGVAVETLELGADEHFEKVREFLGSDKYDAIAIPDGQEA